MASKERRTPVDPDAVPKRREPWSRDLAVGRERYARRDWVTAFERLSSAQSCSALGSEDLQLLAWSAALTGHDDASLDALERLYQAYSGRGEDLRAARSAFWLCFRLFALNEPARAGGWMARAQRLVERGGRDCVERGYLLLPEIIGLLGAGDYGAAHAMAGDAVAVGEHFDDADLVAFAQNLQGRALMRRGQVRAGLRLVDEAMLAATSGELSPLITGLVYCSVIASCQQVFAWQHAREWTAALAAWCDDEPQLTAFTRTCLAHRAEVMQLGGDWPAALEQAQRACRLQLPAVDPSAFADAWYQQAEVHRLRGHWQAAEAGYRQASGFGREPQPGLALLRLAQGHREEAAAAIERVLATTAAAWQRARYLPARVEIALAAGHLEGARAASSELAEIAGQFDTEVLAAMAAHARGAVCLATGGARDAVAPLRYAFAVWQRIGAPYIAARIRLMVGRACEELGDGDGARLERDAARQVFQRLGAAPDLDALRPRAGRGSNRGLSRRETQVLRLVACGKSNKAVADELCLSVRTIDRHLSNIFTKLDVASRTEAAAFAHRHELF